MEIYHRLFLKPTNHLDKILQIFALFKLISYTDTVTRSFHVN